VYSFFDSIVIISKKAKMTWHSIASHEAFCLCLCILVGMSYTLGYSLEICVIIIQFSFVTIYESPFIETFLFGVVLFQRAIEGEDRTSRGWDFNIELRQKFQLRRFFCDNRCLISVCLCVR